MKKLFTLIRQGKRDEVEAILEKKPELISCTAVAPPKKDNGQSPLMVAIKSDNLEVAYLLLDRGADVNFRDPPSQPHNESVPIWYFAVGQCFMGAGDFVSDKSKERSREYYELLRRLLHMGLDPNQKATSEFFPSTPGSTPWTSTIILPAIPLAAKGTRRTTVNFRRCSRRCLTCSWHTE